MFRIGGFDAVGDHRRVRRRNRDRRGVGLAENVADDLRFARFVRGRRRAGVEALVRRTRVLLVPLLAALVDRLEERIVEALDDDDELFLLRQRGTCRQSQRRGGQSECDLLHSLPPMFGVTRDFAERQFLPMTDSRRRRTLTDRPARPTGRRHEGSADESRGHVRPRIVAFGAFARQTISWRTAGRFGPRRRANGMSSPLASPARATPNPAAFSELDPSPFAHVYGRRRHCLNSPKR